MDKLKNLTSKQKWTIGIIVVLLILFVGVKMVKNGGSLAAPKTVSFSKDNKGTRIWLSADGQAKDSKVTRVIKLNGDKATEYNIADANYTLGKFSDMTDSQILNFAKKQDKKEYYNLAKNVELPSLPGFDFMTGDHDDEHFEVDDGDNKVLWFNKEGQVTKEFHQKVYGDPDINFSYSGIRNYDYLRDKWADKNEKIIRAALKRTLSSQSYKGQRTAEIYTETHTDSSGNNVVSQFLSVPTSSWYDDTVWQKNFFDICKKDPSLVKRFYDYDKVVANINNQYMGHLQESETKLRDKKLQEAHDKFIEPIISSKKFQDQLNKGFFTIGDSWDKYNLNSTTSFDVFKARYIGYTWTYDNASGVLVTKAQNDKQQAVFQGGTPQNNNDNNETN